MHVFLYFFFIKILRQMMTMRRLRIQILQMKQQQEMETGKKEAMLL